MRYGNETWEWTYEQQYKHVYLWSTLLHTQVYINAINNYRHAVLHCTNTAMRIFFYLDEHFLLVHWFNDLSYVRSLFLEQLKFLPQQTNLGIELVPLSLQPTHVLSLLRQRHLQTQTHKHTHIQHHKLTQLNHTT